MKSETITLPRELTDNMAEAIAFEANCCGGVASDIWEALVAAAPVDDGWVACSDRLPEDGLPVWVNSEHGVTTGHWCERAYEQYFIVRTETDPGLIARHPTHWHPLPSPPPMKKDPE